MIEFWYCPIFDKEIDEGLCWDISNIGNDSLCLSADERPPCGWEEAYKICKACQHYGQPLVERWQRPAVSAKAVIAVDEY